MTEVKLGTKGTLSGSKKHHAIGKVTILLHQCRSVPVERPRLSACLERRKHVKATSGRWAFYLLAGRIFTSRDMVVYLVCPVFLSLLIRPRPNIPPIAGLVGAIPEVSSWLPCLILRSDLGIIRSVHHVTLSPTPSQLITELSKYACYKDITPIWTRVYGFTMASSNDTNIPTPPSCIVDFCLIPLGTPTASVSKEVAEVQRLLKKSGLDYSMHSAGTTVGTCLHRVARLPRCCGSPLASETTPLGRERPGRARGI